TYARDGRGLRRLGRSRKGVTWCLPRDGAQGRRLGSGGCSRSIHARPCRRGGEEEGFERFLRSHGIRLYYRQLREAVRVRQLLARRVLLRGDLLRQDPEGRRTGRRLRRERVLLLSS